MIGIGQVELLSAPRHEIGVGFKYGVLNKTVVRIGFFWTLGPSVDTLNLRKRTLIT
jgi:hypothetical protein